MLIPSSWPETPERDVCVFVDATNIIMSADDIYQGNFSTKKTLENIYRVAREIGNNVHMVIYLETGDFKKYNLIDYMELGLTARSCGANVIHVPQKDGRDNVDAVMIEDMLQLNRFPDRTIPFLVVTADKHFIPVITLVREHRPIYSGLPTQNKLPSISRTAVGWHWIDRLSWRHMALYDALCPHVCPDQSYVEFTKKRLPDFIKTWGVLAPILETLKSLPTCYCLDDVLEAVRNRLRHQCLSYLPESAWWYYLRALEYYLVIEQQFDKYGNIKIKIDYNHPAFDRISYLLAD